MAQFLIVGLLVLFCAGFWLQRLAPAAMAPFWRGLAGLLRTTSLLPSLRMRAEQLSTPNGASGGCGGCKNCDKKGGGCH